jgi:imidazolonepropionase-like amidohydrolase/DNA-binding CsgD family transcriptional regulator
MEESMGRLILTNARLIDGTGAQPRGNMTVVIEDGRFREIRPQTARLGEPPGPFTEAQWSRLTEQDRQIMDMRYGLGGMVPRSQEDVARDIGISTERIRQLETRILRKLGGYTIRDARELITREDDRVMDLQGKTLLPGLINAHCHVCMDASPDPTAALARLGVAEAILKAAKRCERMLKNGITTARDLGGYQYCELSLRDAIAAGDFPGPRLLCAGRVITMTGGHGWPIGLESDGPDEVRKSARQNLKHGVDCLKFMATGGVLTPGVEPGSPQLSECELRAGVEEARNAGRRTASHAQGTTGIKNSLRAGIDTIEHGIYLDDEAIDMMLKQGAVFVPTLAAPYQIVEAGEAKGIPAYALEKSRRVMDAHRNSFEKAMRAGVTIAAGNDGGTPFNPCEDLVTEMRLMVEYGMKPLDAIEAATLGSAVALGLSGETGTIEGGKWADCIVLEAGADPLADMSAVGRVEEVVQWGKLVAH